MSSDEDVKINCGCFSCVVELIGLIILFWIITHWSQFYSGTINILENTFK
jgi:hypothetical protein